MAQLPGNYNFKVKKGGPWAESVVWKVDGTGVDLTGYTVTLTVYLLTGPVTFTNPTYVTTSASGQIDWTVPTATVTGWNAGFLGYDLKAAVGSGAPEWLLAGTLEVIA